MSENEKTVPEISTAPPSANTEALLRKLSDAADEVLAPLGCHGTISARDDRVMALMDVMYEADKVLGKNGERPKPVPEIRAVRCACPETNGVLVCRAPAGAPGCRFDTVYNGNEKSHSENGAAQAVPSQGNTDGPV